MKLAKVIRIISLATLLVVLTLSQTNVLAQSGGPGAAIRVDTTGNIANQATPGLNPGGSVNYVMDLNNVPADGYTSAEFACRYDPALVTISGVTKASLFGDDALTTLNGPDGGTFIFAIAGVTKKATTSGTAFKFTMTALKAGTFSFECRVRASKGSGLIDIPFTPTSITITDLPTTGTISGKVTAGGKPVTVTITSGATTLTPTLASDGSFSQTAGPATYTVTASASGYLSARRENVTVTVGATNTLTTIALLAGDVDGSGTIDNTDVLTIGMNYNKSTPTAADFNNDGIINVLDLQLLAPNYLLTSPRTW